MRPRNNGIMVLLICMICSCRIQQTGMNNWASLFDGKSLEGWDAGENASTFSVTGGMIKVAGPRAHLFYTGQFQNHVFRNFEFRAKVKTERNANSGIYFHTTYQESNGAAKGCEVQINNSHEDWKRTGSLYGILDVRENYVFDGKWFDVNLTVKDDRVIIKINGIVTVDYTQPEYPQRAENMKGRILGSGTFAIQGHDPGSVVYYKDIMIRPL